MLTWKSWARGIGLSAVALLAGIFAGWTTIDLITGGKTDDAGILDFALEGAVAAMVVASIQRLAMRSPRPRAVPFVLASAGGMAVGWPAGELISEALGWIVSFAVFGLSIGTAQWLRLRSRMPSASAWIPCSAVAWATAAVFVQYSDLNFLLALILGMGSFGAISGGFLVWWPVRGGKTA